MGQLEPELPPFRNDFELRSCAPPAFYLGRVGPTALGCPDRGVVRPWERVRSLSRDKLMEAAELVPEILQRVLRCVVPRSGRLCRARAGLAVRGTAGAARVLVPRQVPFHRVRVIDVAGLQCQRCPRTAPPRVRPVNLSPIKWDSLNLNCRRSRDAFELQSYRVWAVARLWCSSTG